MKKTRKGFGFLTILLFAGDRQKKRASKRKKRRKRAKKEHKIRGPRCAQEGPGERPERRIGAPGWRKKGPEEKKTEIKQI